MSVIAAFGIIINAYLIACYVFLFINSGLKLLYRKIIKELKKWTFRDAVRSWGFDGYDEDEMLTEKEKALGMTDHWRPHFRPHFSWGLFAFKFFVSPFVFFYYIFMVLFRIIILPISYFIGEN